MRAAVGGEYMEHPVHRADQSEQYGLDEERINLSAVRSGPPRLFGLCGTGRPDHFRKHEHTAGAEADVNISGRYDKYSDVGSTTNPKIAANWEIAEGFRLRGNYATAFVAPPLAAIGDPAQGYMRSGGASVSPRILVPVSRYPDVKLLPGCAAATTSCQIGLAINQGLDRS